MKSSVSPGSRGDSRGEKKFEDGLFLAELGSLSQPSSAHRGHPTALKKLLIVEMGKP